jgi:hypothetical protein
MEITESFNSIATAWVSQDEKLDEWRKRLLCAIKSRGIVDVELLLDNPPGQLSNLLNQPLVLNQNEPVTRYSGNERSFGSRCIRFSVPLIFAALQENKELLHLLHSKGASLTTCDAEGDNILHAIVWLSALNPKKEANLCKMYDTILELSPVPVRKKLLLLEDIDGLRPLELAARLGTFLLFRKFIETEHVYKFVIDESPIARRVRYDLTEYECSSTNNRRQVTPLLFLRNMLYTDLEKEAAKELLESPLIQKWIDIKLQKVKYHLVMPFIITVLLIVGLMINDNDQVEICNSNTNVTSVGNHTTGSWLFFYTVVGIEFLYVTSRFAIIIMNRWEAHRSHSSGENRLKRPILLLHSTGVINNTICVCFQIYREITLGVHVILPLLVPNLNQGLLGEFLLWNKINIQLLLWWDLLMYAQVVPGMANVGYIVAGVFRCMGTFAAFMSIFSVFFVSLSEGVRSVAKHYCLSRIGYSAESLYSTFLIMLNMLNPKDVASDASNMPGILIFMHIIVVAFLVILLLNYLIALLTDVVAKIENEKTILAAVTRLQIILDSGETESKLVGILLKFRKKRRDEKFTIECEEYTV